MLERGLADFRWQGKRADGIQCHYCLYERAAHTKFANKKAIPLTLRHCRLFVSYAEGGQQPDGTETGKLNRVVNRVVVSVLVSADLWSTRVDKHGLVFSVVRELVISGVAILNLRAGMWRSLSR